ncbi:MULTISPECIES: hypothetical protein [Serratia]|uniref:hypothetical protein n=1 Tax=Serratia TaxID=613 RepID=UPI0021AE010C|nr:hypothetical protein [Serratia sp. PL7]
MAKTYTYQVQEDVLLHLQRSLDLLSCAQLIINSQDEQMQKYIMSLVDVAEDFTQRAANALDFGEQPQNEQGVCNG